MATKKSLGKFPVFHFGAAFRIGFSPEKRIGERKNVLHFFSVNNEMFAFEKLVDCEQICLVGKHFG